MSKKVKTTNIGKKTPVNYAKVNDRLIEFRSTHPRSSITTEPIMRDDGTIMFKAYILCDKADPNSADATGHALSSEAKGDKVFEKTESIAVGRALALLGYSASGEIASSEEMEEFEKHKEEQLKKRVDEGKKKLDKAKDIGELADVWTKLPPELKVELNDYKSELKKKYEDQKVSE